MSDLLQENTEENEENEENEEIEEIENVENSEKVEESQVDIRVLTAEEVSINKDNAIRKLSSLLDRYISSPDTLKNANNLSYWLSSYSSYLDFEKEFDSTRLKSYKYGDVIKVNLGYNIGDEEGGLHYCIVMDKRNNKSSRILTVIPLTSLKEGKTIHPSTVFLGDEIYQNLKANHDVKMLKFVKEFGEVLKERESRTELSEKDLDEQLEKLKALTVDMEYLQKMEKEITKMKRGSIALVNQITTISKQRIYDPQRNTDILSGLSLSDDSLKLICKKVKQLFIKNFEEN